MTPEEIALATAELCHHLTTTVGVICLVDTDDPHSESDPAHDFIRVYALPDLDPSSFGRAPLFVCRKTGRVFAAKGSYEIGDTLDPVDVMLAEAKAKAAS